MATYGLPDDYYVTFGNRMQSATDAQVNAAARKFLESDRFALVVIGDRSRIETGIKQLNLGDVVLLDGDGRPKMVTP